MKLITALSASATLGLALAACGTATIAVPSSGATPAPTKSSPATGSSAAPSASVPQSAGPSQPPSGSGSQAPAAPPDSGNVPNVTDPWAVVSAYYGDIESGNYRQAWALIGSGATTGQTYQQFADGFACTGSQQLTEVSESGNQVQFDLAATNDCNGQVQDFTGTDTVENGTIVAAHVVQTN